ncbi:MAG: NAD(P)-dependent oxidoreductase [Patescibacteria group bacterium]|jgi:nucleoside-diphosphate-sugar epimerase
MKILITGGTGFIGKHLIRRLQLNGHKVCAVTRPSSDTHFFTEQHVETYTFDKNIDDFTRYFQTQHFDGVVHLASLFLAQHKSADIPNLVDSNVFFATALLEAASKGGVGWFINTGTFWQHYQDSEYDPVNLYAATKQAFQDIAKYYAATSSINFVTLQLSDTFGPGDTRPKIFNLWMKHAKTHERLDMSPGDQCLDISYIDNVIDGYVRLTELLTRDTERKSNGCVFALTSGRSRPLKELADIFQKVTGVTLNIQWGARPYRPREVMETWSKGVTIPGWTPAVSLEEGIQRTFHE